MSAFGRNLLYAAQNTEFLRVFKSDEYVPGLKVKYKISWLCELKMMYSHSFQHVAKSPTIIGSQSSGPFGKNACGAIA